MHNDPTRGKRPDTESNETLTRGNKPHLGRNNKDQANVGRDGQEVKLIQGIQKHKTDMENDTTTKRNTKHISSEYLRTT